MVCMLRGGLHWHGSALMSGNCYILFVLSLSMTSMISIFVSIVESGTNKFENVRCLQLDFISSCLVLRIDYLSCKSFDYKLLSHTITILFMHILMLCSPSAIVTKGSLGHLGSVVNRSVSSSKICCDPLARGLGH